MEESAHFTQLSDQDLEGTAEHQYQKCRSHQVILRAVLRKSIQVHGDERPGHTAHASNYDKID